MHLEEIYKRYVGDFGRYQLMVVCFLLAIRTPSPIHNIGYVFFARTPDHYCSFNTKLDFNFTYEEWKLFSVPKNGETWSHCELYTWNKHVNNLTVDDVNSTLMALRRGESFGEEFRYRCDRWDYDTWTDVHDSLVTQWDLVCDRKWMKSLMASIFAVGSMLGCPIIGYLCDRYGRRPLLRISFGITVILGIINPFVNHYIGFLTVRFILSFFLNGGISVVFTMAMEVTGPSKRSLISNLYSVVWAVVYMILAGVAYLFRDRLIFMIAAAAPTALILVPLWFVPESIPWLICKGQEKRANKLIQKMARMNRKTLPADTEVTVEKGTEKTATHVRELFRTSSMRKTTIILAFNWFTDALLFYAVSWNGVALHGNLYLNVFLAGFIEIPAYLLNIVLLQCLGRRLSMSGSTFLAGLALLITLGVPKGLSGLLATLTLTSKFCITIAFIIAYQYATELYPTYIRTLGLNCCNSCARVGGLVASYIPLMVSDRIQFKGLPQLLCGTVAVLASFTLLFLPETLGQPLPVTMEEADELHQRYNIRDVFRLPKRASHKEPTLNETAEHMKPLTKDNNNSKEQSSMYDTRTSYFPEK